MLWYEELIFLCVRPVSNSPCELLYSPRRLCSAHPRGGKYGFFVSWMIPSGVSLSHQGLPCAERGGHALALNSGPESIIARGGPAFLCGVNRQWPDYLCCPGAPFARSAIGLAFPAQVVAASVDILPRNVRAHGHPAEFALRPHQRQPRTEKREPVTHRALGPDEKAHPRLSQPRNHPPAAFPDLPTPRDRPEQDPSQRPRRAGSAVSGPRRAARRRNSLHPVERELPGAKR